MLVDSHNHLYLSKTTFLPSEKSLDIFFTKYIPLERLSFFLGINKPDILVLDFILFNYDSALSNSANTL